MFKVIPLSPPEVRTSFFLSFPSSGCFQWVFARVCLDKINMAAPNDGGRLFGRFQGLRKITNYCFFLFVGGRLHFTLFFNSMYV